MNRPARLSELEAVTAALEGEALARHLLARVPVMG